LKIKEAQTFSLSEQLKVRDDVINRTRNAIREQGTGGSNTGNLNV
jgi:hypothetical protein